MGVAVLKVDLAVESETGVGVAVVVPDTEVEVVVINDVMVNGGVDELLRSDSDGKTGEVDGETVEVGDGDGDGDSGTVESKIRGMV